MKKYNNCRCCGVGGCFMELSENYTNAGKLENYGEMITKTFNLNLNSQEFICEECIIKVRDASKFRQQIVDAAKRLTEVKGNESKNEELKLDHDENGQSDYPTLTDDLCEEVFIDIKSENKVVNHPKMDNRSQPCENIIKMETADDNIKKVIDKKGNRLNKATKLKYSHEQKEKTKNKLTEAQKELCENTFKLISNSNICLFKSLRTRFACYLCKETFFEIKLLREHAKMHPIDIIWLRVKKLKGMSFLYTDITNLTCKICSEICNDLEILKKHLNQKHGIDFGESANHLLVPFKVEDSFQCIICNDEFNTFTSLSTHMNRHSTSNVCETCGTVFYNRSSLRLHVHAIHKEKKCPQCPQTFQTSSKLTQHLIKTHNRATSKRYCKKCDMTFRHTYALDNHMIENHGAKQRTTECNYCGKTIKNSLYLKVHIRSVHLKERNYPCSLCGLRFFTSTDKTRHEQTHQESCNFACIVCEAKFKSKDSVRRHMKRQHENSSK